jgi:pimeloyl-ACP methyl ester carboxylesterase
LPNGLKIWCQEAGAGPALVLLHGATLSAAKQRARIPIFAEKFRVVAVDSRGHGHTINPTSTLSYPMMADDVALLLRELSIERACFFGVSDGANIALELAMRHPAAVAALALAGVVHRKNGVYLKGLVDYFGELGSEADLDRFEQRHPDFVADRKLLHAHQGEDHWRRLLLQIWPMLKDPFQGADGYRTEDLRAMHAPTLLLIGDRDEFIPVEETVELFRLLPDARLRVEPNLGHGAHPSWPQLALEFFQERVSQPA